MWKGKTEWDTTNQKEEANDIIYDDLVAHLESL